MSDQLWEYLGPGGEPVGPQSLAELQDWMEKQFMDGDQRVRPLGGSHWVELRNASWATYHALLPGFAAPAPAAPGSWAAKTANSLPYAPFAPRAAVPKPSVGNQGSGQASNWGSVSNWGAPAPPKALNQQAGAAAPAPMQPQRSQQQGTGKAPPPPTPRNGSKQGRNGGRKQKSVGYVEDKQWLFKRRGEVQGPFTGPEMREFLEDEAFFDQEVMVKKTDWKDYKPLEQVFEIIVQMYSLPPARSAVPPQEPLCRAGGGSYGSFHQASLGGSSSRSIPDAWEEDAGAEVASAPGPALANSPPLAAEPQGQPTELTPSAWGLSATPLAPSLPPQQVAFGAAPAAAAAPPTQQQQVWGAGPTSTPQGSQAGSALPAAAPAQVHVALASCPHQEQLSTQESEQLPAHLAGLSLTPPAPPIITPIPADALAPISTAAPAPVPAYAPAPNPVQAPPAAAPASSSQVSAAPSSARPRPGGSYRPMLYSSKVQPASSSTALASAAHAGPAPGVSAVPKPLAPGFTAASSTPAAAPAAPPGSGAPAQQPASAAQAVPAGAAGSLPKKALTWSEMSAARRAAAAATEGTASSAASLLGLGSAAHWVPPPGMANTAQQQQSQSQSQSQSQPQQQQPAMAALVAAGPSAPSSPVVALHAMLFPKESKSPSPAPP